MALTPKQRDQRRREKQERLGEQDLRLKVTTTHASKLAEMMSWGEIEESGEALTLLIYNAHKLGRSRFPFFATGARLEIESDQQIKADRTEIRLMARRGTVQQLDDMGEWINADDRSFIVRTLIERAHALGPIQALTLLSLPPRHEFEISDSVARALDQWRMQRELRAPDIRLGADPDDKGLLLIADHEHCQSLNERSP
ncbi:hypothetical protein OO256_22155 [Pseudomonas sp. DCB_CB]|uniref:hypothetical protein n=1 Tax=unclassified Pseudomonas TaxID=196821 RepID=UPI0022487B5D|nr:MULTISPECIES: hypothetical protein [unclassified Pseudomonas]MCX2693705.1 hypothetical protein [Pseudomonas sp. DCB_BZ]MCX2858793.1 hypothetical protein [Pseudomonas sp. DCB_CB]